MYTLFYYRTTHNSISNRIIVQHFMNINQQATMTTTATNPSVVPDTSSATTVNTPPIKKSGTKYTKWTRLNHKGIYHDNRRLLKHREKNCECSVCYREIYKLPPMETQRQYIASLQSKKASREMKKIQRTTRKEIKTGKQETLERFFRSAP
jgi:hypothetical protein